MSFDPKAVRAVVFDYGSTLIEFAKPQITACDAALAGALARHFGNPDMDRLLAIRNRDRMAPYQTPEYRENDLVEITANLVRDLYGVEPAGEQIADILKTRHDIFVRVVHAEPHVFDVLEYLGRKYKIGLLSNYPDGAAIRDSLERTGLAQYFDAVVVSGDLGVVKPHPVPYITVLSELRVKAHRAVLVGDNWLGDIQGAKGAGLQAILTTQWQTPEVFPREDHHVEPDAVITHLDELKGLL